MSFQYACVTLLVPANAVLAFSAILVYFCFTDEAPYEFYWDTTANQNGVYMLKARAYDKAGNIGESNTVTVTINNSATRTIDTNPPLLNILQPLNGATVSKTIDIRAEATDESGISKVEFYINNKLAATATAEPYTYRWNTRSVKNGWHTITVKAYDNQGNTAQTTIKVYVQNRK